ncbi:universal stress protein [Streptomyces sp. NPDC051217]|uniref:universal stress protein n=1 Tax=Streptomyces sp. NPDC051217 TaxID=3365644 RepID=UPI0037B81D9C
MYRNILVAVDGTPAIDAVVDTTMSLAKYARTTMHVRPSDFLYSPAPAVLGLEDDQRAKDVVDAAVARLRHAGIITNGEMLHGQRRLRADAVLREANRLGSSSSQVPATTSAGERPCTTASAGPSPPAPPSPYSSSTPASPRPDGRQRHVPL